MRTITARGSYAAPVISGAFAAALTPLRDGGAALDEAAFAPYVDFLAGGRRRRHPRVRDDGRGDPALGRGAAARGRALPRGGRRRRVPVAVHCGAQTTADTAALAAHAAEAGAAAVAVIAPPYFALDERALEAHFAAAAAACAPLPFYVYEFAARSGYAVPVAVDRAAARDGAEPARAEGLRQAVGGGRAVPARRARRLRRRRGARRARARARRGRRGLRARVGLPGGRRGARARADARSARPRPSGCAARSSASRSTRRRRRSSARRGVPIGPRRARAAAPPDRRPSSRELDAAVILVAGAGAMGASIAYHLALARRARRRPLRPRRDRRRLDRRGDGRRAAAVLDRGRGAARARERSRSSRSSGQPFFDQVGYLFLATTEDGLARARGAASSCRRSLGVPVERVDASSVRRARVDDVLGAVVLLPKDGVADPPAVTRELVRRAAELGVEVREDTDARAARTAGATRSSSRAGRGRPRSARSSASSCPCGRSAGSCCRPRRSSSPERLPMVVEAETGFHFRRRGDAARARDERRGAALGLRDGRRRDGLRRPARAARAPLPAGGRRDDRRRVGGPLRHDARRAPDHRPRRRRRLRRLRLLRPRLHAVAGGRPGARRGDPRRRPLRRPTARPSVEPDTELSSNALRRGEAGVSRDPRRS